MFLAQLKYDFTFKPYQWQHNLSKMNSEQLFLLRSLPPQHLLQSEAAWKQFSLRSNAVGKKGEGPTGDPDLSYLQAGWLFAATADLIWKYHWCSALGLDILNRTAVSEQKATAGGNEIAGEGGKWTFTHHPDSLLFMKLTTTFGIKM